jgi:hypothetical protein
LKKEVKTFECLVFLTQEIKLVEEKVLCRRDGLKKKAKFRPECTNHKFVFCGAKRHAKCSTRGCQYWASKTKDGRVIIHPPKKSINPEAGKILTPKHKLIPCPKR